MENTILGIGLTIISPFAVLGLASIVRKLGAGAETSRKIVHILLSNWILLAIAVYQSAWTACILPACFIPLNYLSWRKGIFSAIERGEANTLGTVWYAVSLFLLCLAGFSLDMPWIAACGMLAMGYGDGFGALIGKSWGKLRFPPPYSQKSLEGMLNVMLFSGLAVYFVCAVYAQELSPLFPVRAALSCAVPAAVIELLSPRGIDNLSLPLSVGLIVFLLALFPALWPVFVCLSFCLLILIAAYFLRAITLGAMFASILLGVSLFVFGGWLCFSALVLFFIFGSAVSRIGRNIKKDAHNLHERNGARSIPQVAANGLHSLIFALAYYFTGVGAFLLAVLVCFATASADTFSSEIGMLSKNEPVSILTLKPMRRGLSGGVTPLGFFSGFLGAFFVSLLAIPRFGIRGMLTVTAAGFIGSVLDSVLGAALQAKYQFPSDGDKQLLTESKELNAAPLELAYGFRRINNDVVNFVSVFICGLIVAAIG